MGGLEAGISESTQSELFAGSQYYEPGRFQDRLVLVDTVLPELPGVSEEPLPPFDDWYNDGVPFLANDWKTVLASLLETEVTEISPAHQLYWKYLDLVDNKMWGRASTLADAALKLSYPDPEDWEHLRFEANLVFVHVGIEESLGLPFSEYSPTDYEVVHPTPIKPKHFWCVRRVAARLAQDDPDRAKPYLDIVDGLFLENVLSYPDIGSFLHQMSKSYGFDAMNPEIQGVYDRIKERDEEWRANAGTVFQQHIVHHIEKTSYGRAGILLSVGLRAGLLSTDYAREQFLRKYNQLNLAIAIPEHLLAMEQTVITSDTTYPPLTHFKSMVQELWQADDALKAELEDVMAHREFEVIQHLQTSPGDLSDYEKQLIDEEASVLIAQLPDTDPQKQRLANDEIDKKINEMAENPEALSSLKTDRFLEQTLSDLSHGVIDAETFAQLIDQTEDAVLANMRLEINGRSLELLAGYLAPLCRTSKETPDQVISKRFIDEAIQLIGDAAEHMDEKGKKYYTKFMKALAESPRSFHELYWRIYEEYVH